MERIKAIVDYALDGNLTEMRDTLHAEMLDRVQLTLEGLKKYVAQSLILPEGKEENDKDEDDDDKKEKKSKKEDEEDGHDDEKEDKKLVKKMVKKDALKNEEAEPLDETPETKPKKVVQGTAPAGTFAADKAAGKFKTLNKKFGDPNKKPKKVVGEEAEQIDEKNWIKGAIKHKGALHKELGVPEGKKIPEKELEKAAHASGKEGRRARLAMTLKGLK